MKRLLRRLLAIAALFALFFVVLAGFAASSGPALLAWHSARLDSEFRSGNASVRTWPQYLELEDRLFAELTALIQQRAEPDCAKFDRYCPGSFSDPEISGRNWNRSLTMDPEGPAVGAAVLLHGLMGSPHNMISAAEPLVEAGYQVTIPRLPGHGTIPAELERTVREDWTAAVRLAVRHAAERAPGKLLLGGYSNGGSLALEYALDAADDPSLPAADRVALFAPALEIDPLAAYAWWPRILRWTGRFEQARWLDTQLEVSPYRYYSLSYQSVEQCHNLGREVRRRLQSEAGALPPVLTFHSAPDSTVRARAIVNDLHARLPGEDHELILLGVNRGLEATGLVNPVPEWRPPADGVRLTIWPRPRAGWPPRFHSVSHVGMMISPDDPLDGRIDNPADIPVDRYHFEALRIWSEVGLQQMDSREMTRPRYNPFWPETVERLRRFAQR